MLNTQSMNLDYIRTFVIVGQSKDFNDAASKLNIDATNVSRHIKALESIMKTKLINKNSKNYIELTEDGQLLFDGYEKAYNLLFITEKTYLQSKTLDSGKISIGISSDIENSILNTSIIEFKKMFPEAAFKIINLPAKNLFEKLSHYTIDFVIDEQIDGIKKSSGIISVGLKDEEYCLVYDSSKFNLRELKDLSEQPLILPVSTKKERRLFEELLSKNHVNRKLSIETANYNSAIEYAMNGLGIALVPMNILEEYKNNIDRMNVDIKKKISISYVQENLSPLSKEFLKKILTLSEK